MLSDLKPLDILVVAPHPDDAELGMGGAILQYKADGYRVGVLDLTDGEPTPFGSPEIRAAETAAATRILGLDWRGNLGLPNRSLQATLEARRQLAGVFRQLKPRLLFAPYWVDAHPDHTAAVELIEAARFWSKLTKTDLPGEPHHPARILYYQCVHLRLVLQPAFVLDISRTWAKKLAAIECYRSQFISGRETEPLSFLDRLRDQAAFWGWSIGAAYGEAFASREPVGLASLRDLV
jgi:N-acetylglucosamine malate deacetylase 1